MLGIVVISYEKVFERGFIQCIHNQWSLLTHAGERRERMYVERIRLEFYLVFTKYIYLMPALYSI